MINKINLNEAISIVSESNEFRLLRKATLKNKHFFRDKLEHADYGLLAVIDTETTGFEPNNGDRIIDLAIATCSYSLDTGELSKIESRYEGLEDPGFLIPNDVQALTGITDEMVKGKALCEESIADVMNDVAIVICHNADFDRKFLESRIPSFVNKSFACSFREIPWADWGIASQKLDYLGFKFGFFHEGHRAKTDVDMLIKLLNQKAPNGEGSILSVLLGNARKKSFRVHAVNLPYEKKDIVKSSGYRWHDGKYGKPRAWWKDTFDKKAEIVFLEKHGCNSPVIEEFTAKTRYRPEEI